MKIMEMKCDTKEKKKC